MRRIILPVFAMFALALAGALPASAQAQQQPPGAQDMTFGADDLKSYASARVEIRKINDEYMPQFQGAPTKEEKEAVRKEATDKMVEAIRAEGISVEKYNAISQAAQANPDLANRIRQHMENAQ